jgi:hypothetical protein
MEYDLEEEVAQFVAEVREIAPVDGVGHLIRFFERVGCNGREILLQVPRAARAGCPQRRHDLDEPGDVLRWLHSCSTAQVFFLSVDGASATTASVVSSRNVSVSCKYRRTALSVWLK